MDQFDETDEGTSRFLTRPPPDSPDVLLTNFLCSGEIVVSNSDGTPQQKLKNIINDKRWTRRMLEEWLKKGPQSNYFSVTPNPEFRAIYLILLSLLEDQGNQNIDPNEQNNTNTITTEEEMARNKESSMRVSRNTLTRVQRGRRWT